MPKYVIERGIPGAGSLSDQELQDISRQSCDVLRDLGGDVQWQHSYVAEDKVYCVYIAPDSGRVREHARLGGFPADVVTTVSQVIDPTTAEARVAA